MTGDSEAQALRHLERLPAPRRRSHWDRPPPPHDWRWVVGTIGKVLIATGLLMFGFVAYQLWGTGLEYAQAQDRLDEEFEQLIATVATTSTTTAVTTSTTERTTTVPGTSPPTMVVAPTSVDPTTTEPASAPAPTVPEFVNGDVLARMEIPRIGLDTKVVSGVQPGDLKAGPGHYPDTPMPGQFGNAAVAGHRTTYGQPFFRLDEVAAGDEIVVTTVQGRFVYRMTSSEIVSASQSDVVATTDPSVARLTLTTCHPRYSASKRLIVFAELDLVASNAPQPPIVAAETPAPQSLPPGTLPGGPTTQPSVSTTAQLAPSATTPDPTVAPPVAEAADPSTDASAEVSEESADAFAQGWFSDDGAFAQVALWGLVVTAIAGGAYLLSRTTRRNWVGAVVGVVPFVLALYFFFQNVNRLLPAAL